MQATDRSLAVVVAASLDEEIRQRWTDRRWYRTGYGLRLRWTDWDQDNTKVLRALCKVRSRAKREARRYR